MEKKATYQSLNCGRESGGDKLASDNVGKDVKNLNLIVSEQEWYENYEHEREADRQNEWI